MANENPADRQPKGDHNRRLALGIDPDAFAAEAGVTTEQLRDYERTAPDHRFDVQVAERVGATLERLEAVLPNFETTRAEPAPGMTVDQVGTGVGPAEGHTDGNFEESPRYGTAGENEPDQTPSKI